MIEVKRRNNQIRKNCRSLCHIPHEDVKRWPIYHIFLFFPVSINQPEKSRSANKYSKQPLSDLSPFTCRLHFMAGKNRRCFVRVDDSVGSTISSSLSPSSTTIWMCSGRYIPELRWQSSSLSFERGTYLFLPNDRKTICFQKDVWSDTSTVPFCNVGLLQLKSEYSQVQIHPLQN